MYHMMRKYLEISRFFNMGLTGVAPVLGALSMWNIGETSLLNLAVLFAIGCFSHVYGFVINDIMDVKVDQLSKEFLPRPLVSGNITVKKAAIFAVGCMILSFLFSLIFRPPFEMSHTFRLTVLSSLAVAESIRRETGLETLIKWPNDVYIKGKKVCGILSELGVRDEKLLYAIVGIGINVNSDPSIDHEIRDIATSISLELRQSFSRLKLLKVILELIEHYYYVLKEGDFKSIRKHWDALSLIKGKKVKVVSSGNTQEGFVESFDEDGFLILRDYSGKRERIISADVSLSLV